MGDMVPRWQVLEQELKAYRESTDQRLTRIEEKVDAIQSFVDNLKGRAVVLAFFLALVFGILSPLIVALALRAF